MTRKRCRKMLMSTGAQKRDVDEYMDNMLPECRSYEEIIVSTLAYAVMETMKEANDETQKTCYARCCL